MRSFPTCRSSAWPPRGVCHCIRSWFRSGLPTLLEQSTVILMRHSFAVPSITSNSGPLRVVKVRFQLWVCSTHSLLVRTAALALQAFARASKQFPKLKLVAFSEWPPRPQLPLPPNTEFHVRPAQVRLRELYAQCDAWLFSSQTEGFGLPILEAMACRTPVIGTSAGAAPELLSGGGGIFVASDDPNDMALAIEHILTMSEPDWMRLSDLAVATAARYTWDNATDQFETALRTATEKQKHRTTV